MMCQLVIGREFFLLYRASTNSLDSYKTFVLTNPSGLLLALLQLQPLLSLPLSLASLKCLRKASIYGSLGWMSDTWRSPIGDTCHNLIGSPMSSLTRARSPVSLLTRDGLLMSLLTRAEVLVSLLTRDEV